MLWMCYYRRKFCGKHQSAAAAATVAQIADFEKHFRSHSCGKANIKKKGGRLHEGQRDIALGNQSNGASQEELCSDNQSTVSANREGRFPAIVAYN